MKRVYYGLLVACLALVLCAAPGWAASVSDFANLQTALSSGGEITLAADIEVTATLNVSKADTVIKGNGKTLKRGSSFKTGSLVSCEAVATFDNIIFDGNSVETTISTANTGGGALFINAAKATVTNCTFKNHKIKVDKGYTGGGAIHTKDAKEGTVIENCRFENNIVSGTGNEHGGGAIYNLATNDASLTITNCQFYKNGNFDDNSSNSDNGSGGAMTNIVSTASKTLSITLNNCSFDANKMIRYGGAIYNITDEVAGTVSIDIENCEFTNNTLNNYKNNGSFGGAVANFAATGTINMAVENSLFKKNSAYNTAPQTNKPQSYFGTRGGAIGNWTLYKVSSGKITSTVTGCRFEENEANYGGAIVNWGNSGEANISLLKDCTFIGNKAVTSTFFAPDKTTQGTTVKGYPLGSAIFANAKADGNSTNVYGKAYTTVINCTFTGNESHSGGVISNKRDSENDTVTTTVYNCTFVNNKLTGTDETSAAGGVEVYNDGGTLNVTNTILWNDSAANIVSNANSGTVTLTNSAYKTAPASTVATSTNGKAITALANASKPVTVTVNDIEHTVFRLTVDDKDLIRGGAKTTGTPEADILGVTRSTSAPSIGAVEYLTLKGSSSVKALTAGTVGVVYSADLDTSTFAFTPAQNGVEFIWATAVSSGDLPDGIKISGDQVAGTPTKAGTYYFTIDATGSGDVYSAYAASQDFSLVINEAPKSSPDIGTVSITVKNAVGSNTAAFSVNSGDVKLVTSNDLTSSVKVNGTAYKLASSDATPVFSVNAGNATLKGAYMGDANSDWSSTSDLDDLTITNLTAISGQEAISETSPDYYRFQFNVSDDYYFTLELSVLLSGEPEAKVTSDEVTSGSVSEPTETFTSGDETYYRVPANGSDNLVTKNASGVWQLPRVISFAIMGGFNNFISMMRGIERTIAQIVTGIFQPNADGLFTNIGATLSTAVHPGTIFIIRLAPSGWSLPFMAGFERGAMRVAKVEDGAIIGAMTVQNTAGNSNINENITTLHIDTSDLRDPDDSSVKVPVPEGAYAISYSTLNGEVYGAFSDDIKVAAANYTPSNGDDDTDTDDEQETSSHGGSSGCNAGFGLFALAALALAYKKFSK